MSNLMLGFPNRIDSSALSGGSWKASLPLANLQDRTIGIVAESTDATLASTKFDVDLGSQKQIRVIGLRNHNLSLAAKMRIRGANVSDFSAAVVDSGWFDVWPVVYPSSTLEWEDDNWWSGKYTDEQRAGYTPETDYILSANKLARYWRIEIDDTTNTAGCVQVGRLFIGPAWQPTYNMSLGVQIGWRTDSKVSKALSSAKSFRRSTPFRFARFALNLLSLDEGMANAFEIQRRAGIDQEVLFIFDPADTVHALRRRFLGTLVELSPIEYPFQTKTSTAFEIEESL